MKKVFNLSPSKILMVCGLGLATTLGGFWHHQINQKHLSTIHVVNQGLNTCFGRVNQSFTAMMIKDVKSPYLDQGFAQLSNACMEELKGTFKSLGSKLPKAEETLNKLNAEVTWFHEKLGKIHSPMLLGQGKDTNLAPLQERYSQMETLKVALADELDAGMHRLSEIQFSDEVVMGGGLILFMLGLGLMVGQEMRRISLRTQAETMAVNMIKNNQAHVGAMVDSLIMKALLDQGQVVTAQIFKDYHEAVLEGMTQKVVSNTEEMLESTPKKIEASEAAEIRSSLREVLSSLKVLNLDFEASEVSETDLKIEQEDCTQIMSVAINKLLERRVGKENVQIHANVQADRCIVELSLFNAAFNSSELEGMGDISKLNDPYLMVLHEMSKGQDMTWKFENAIDEATGKMVMCISLNLPVGGKAKNLVSVVKGKKRDIARGFMN